MEEKRPFRIGEPTPRFDAWKKVTGEERYAADYYDGDLLRAGVKRAGVPHGTLKGIKLEEAKALPGVVSVLTHADITGSNREGILKKDKPVLVDGRIRSPGDAIAIVVAESKEILKQALALITFEYDPLPGVFDAEEALREGAVVLHDDNPDKNLLRTVSILKGTGKDALKKSDVVVEGEFHVPCQEHAYLETESGWACYEKEGGLVIVVSTQTPFRDRLEIGHAIGVAPEKIRIITPYLGGAFGGKDGVTVQCLLGVAAMRSPGRPVKMQWDREESLLASTKRVPARMRYRLGAKNDGTLHALRCVFLFDAGPYTGLCGEVMTLGLEHAGGAYRIPNTSIQGWCVYTNNPMGGPFRGFGVPQVTAGMEQMMDILAERLAMDPLELRRKNALRRGDRNPIGTELTFSTGVVQCIDALSSNLLWKERDEWKRAAPPFKRRGVGIACLCHAMGYPAVVPDYANAKIELTLEGKIRVYAGIVDMGQGNASTYLQIAGDILGQDGSHMELVLPDTERTLPSGSSSASRTTYTYGNALVAAANELKRRIAEKLSPGGDPTGCLFSPGIITAPSGERLSLIHVAGLLDETERVCTYTFTVPTAQANLQSIYMGPHIVFSYGAHLARVEVDELTGETEVKGYCAVTEAGTVLNIQAYEQQIQGAVAQGIGYAVHEDFIVEEGRVKTTDLSTYTIPTALDIPDMVTVALDIPDDSSPLAMKGIGEISINGPLPAVSNAIADATGTRIFKAPFTGERVLSSIKFFDA